MNIITSLENPFVKHCVKLQDNAYRHEHKHYIAQGEKVCFTLAKHHTVHTLLVLESYYEQHKEALNSYQYIIVSDSVMKKIATIQTTPQIIGIFEYPRIEYHTPSEDSIVLYDIQDPGNAGTIIRSAAAMGIRFVFSIEGADPYSPKVVQASAGTLAYVSVIRTTWKDFYDQYSSQVLCALTASEGITPQEHSLEKAVFVIGNEGQGLPEHIVKQCSQSLTIPMPGRIESLNAAVAGSIALYIKYIEHKR